jgi:hypothetical protein
LASEAVGSIPPIALICTVEKIQTAYYRNCSIVQWEFRWFGGELLDIPVKVIQPSAKPCCLGLKIVLLTIMAFQISLIFLNRIRLQAYVHLGQVEFPLGF